MTTYREHGPVDILEVERIARKARAEAFAEGIRAARRWIAARFTGQPQNA